MTYKRYIFFTKSQRYYPQFLLYTLRREVLDGWTRRAPTIQCKVDTTIDFLKHKCGSNVLCSVEWGSQGKGGFAIPTQDTTLQILKTKHVRTNSKTDIAEKAVSGIVGGKDPDPAKSVFDHHVVKVDAKGQFQIRFHLSKIHSL
mmetsp:Transcript_126454/g.188692  ORF Transcript_126454/g.188692 Transcript_126454/m.188692 type:complete len:144 (-) Transcript_126454:1229-1660(-)